VRGVGTSVRFGVTVPPECTKVGRAVAGASGANVGTSVRFGVTVPPECTKVG